MKFTHFIGIDVPKNSLQLALATAAADIIAEEQTPNDAPAVSRMIHRWVGKHTLQLASCLCCLEPTGPYSHGVSKPYYLWRPTSGRRLR